MNKKRGFFTRSKVLSPKTIFLLGLLKKATGKTIINTGNLAIIKGATPKAASLSLLGLATLGLSGEALLHSAGVNNAR